MERTLASRCSPHPRFRDPSSRNPSPPANPSPADTPRHLNACELARWGLTGLWAFWQALQVATENANVEMVVLLLMFGADPESVTTSRAKGAGYQSGGENCTMIAERTHPPIPRAGS